MTWWTHANLAMMLLLRKKVQYGELALNHVLPSCKEIREGEAVDILWSH